MTKIVFACNNATYAQALVDSIGTVDGVTVSIDNATVTVEFATAQDSFFFALVAQVRLNSLTAYAEKSESGNDPAPVPTYTLTLMNGNPRMGGTMEMFEYVEGAALELPTLEATGKKFLGWVDGEGNAAPEVMPAEALALYANWEVTAYTLTIKQNGAEDKVFTFGVEYTMTGIDITVNDLSYVLADNLPAGYSWAEEVPTTFELKDYTFTAVAPHVHSYEAVVTPATCTEGGYTTYTCECGESYTEEGDPATDHNYVDGVCSECDAEDPNYVPAPEYAPMTIAESLTAAVGTKVEISGTVSKIYQGWNSQYNNISVYLKDSTGEIIVFRASVRLAVGDVITVKGVIGQYNSVNQIAEGSTVVITQAHTCQYSEATCKVPATCTLCDVAKDDILGAHAYVDGICSVCNAVDPDYEGDVVELKTVSLSFSSKNNRTTYTTSQQIWEQNGIKLINDKASSTSNVGDYANPARFYKSSKLTVECAGMTKIVFTCNSASYATALKSSITGANVTVSGSDVIITFDEPVDTFVIASLTGGQVRINSMSVTVVA